MSRKLAAVAATVLIALSLGACRKGDAGAPNAMQSEPAKAAPVDKVQRAPLAPPPGSAAPAPAAAPASAEPGKGAAVAPSVGAAAAAAQPVSATQTETVQADGFQSSDRPDLRLEKPKDKRRGILRRMLTNSATSAAN